MLDVVVVSSENRSAIFLDGVKRWDDDDSPAGVVASITGGEPCRVRSVWLPDLAEVPSSQQDRDYPDTLAGVEGTYGLAAGTLG